MNEFLDMKGYGIYVWPSYVLTLGALWFNVWIARRQLRSARAEARRRLAMLEQNP